MHVSAANSTVGRNCSIQSAIGKAKQGSVTVRPDGLADVHLIAAERLAVSDRNSADLDERLVPRQRRFDIKQAQTRGSSGRALDAVRIGYTMSQHLVAAAETEDTSASANMSAQIDIPAVPPEIL